MTRHPILIALLALIAITGCSTKSPNIIDLHSATELIVSPNTNREVRLANDELAQYLDTFDPIDTNEFVLHTISEQGTLTINRHAYPITLGHVKVADHRATLTITNGNQQHRFIQRADSKPRLRSI